MQTIKINATRRQQAGKGGARRVRDTGKIPAIAYGKDLAALPLAVSPEQLHQVLLSERGRNSVVEVQVEGQDNFTALLTDYQYHPISRSLLHADFLQIALDKEVDVEVALELTGKAAGIVLGGTLRQVFRVLPLRCLPEKIPVKISYDVTPLGLDGHVQVRDLALPEGVSVRLPPERTLVAIVKEKQAMEEEAAPVAAAAAAAPAAGAKAEPAAADKKADKKSDKK
jgi:large subunit ribosomal protein L25